MRGSDTFRSAWILTALAAACAGPHTAPNLPVKGDHRHHAFRTIESRDHALNARDLPRVAASYAPEAEVVDLETGEVMLRGREAIRAELGALLARCAELRIEVVKRSYAERGRFVSDLERTHCSGAAPVEEWVKYEIAELEIVRVWKRRPPAR